MEAIMDWVSSHIIEILTFLLVCITGYYAFLTSCYVRLTRQALEENRQMRLDAQKPEIGIYLDVQSKIAAYCVDLYVENIGPGAAYDVKFTTDLSFYLDENKPLEEVPFLRYGISYLQPGQRRKGNLNEFSLLKVDEIRQKRLKIAVTYKDAMSKKYERCFCLDFREH